MASGQGEWEDAATTPMPLFLLVSQGDSDWGFAVGPLQWPFVLRTAGGHADTVPSGEALRCHCTMPSDAKE